MHYFITGTDTNAGKTIASCILLEKNFPSHMYFKPVQTGYPEDDDSRKVKLHLMNAAPSDPDKAAARVTQPGYVYREPYSPHLAARLEGEAVQIPGPEELAAVIEKRVSGKEFLIEGAGGLLVPVTAEYTWVDLLVILQKNKFPFRVILAARTGLGTINHTLLSIRELERNSVPVEGLFFCGPLYGEPFEDNMRYISEKSGYRILGTFNTEQDKPE